MDWCRSLAGWLRRSSVAEPSGPVSTARRPMRCWWSTASCRPWASGLASLPAGAETIDLDGGFLMASFGDGHAHPLPGGLEAVGPQVRPCKSVDEIVDAVRQFAVEHPDEEWIVGASYESSLAHGRPVRRPLAGRRRRRSARRAARLGLPHGVVQLRRTGEGRHHRRHARPPARSDSAPRRRLGAGHTAGVGRGRPGVQIRPRPRPQGADRRPRHGRRLLPCPRRDLGAGRLGGARRRRHLHRRRPSGRAGRAVQPRAVRRPQAFRHSARAVRRRTSPRRGGRLCHC